MLAERFGRPIFRTRVTVEASPRLLPFWKTTPLALVNSTTAVWLP